MKPVKERNRAFGARLKAAMKIAGYKSVREFCDKNHIFYLTVAQHTQGTRNPSDENLTKYSELFGVTKEWLKTGEGLPLSVLKKSQEIINLSTAELEKHTKINELLHKTLDVPLLTEVIKYILSNKLPFRGIENGPGNDWSDDHRMLFGYVRLS